MNIKRLGVTLFLFLLIVILLFVNIGLNISGPFQYEEAKNKTVLETVNKRYPLIHHLYRHSFKYVTYSYYNDTDAYLFDNEGKLVIKKEFHEKMLDEIQQICKEKYQLENVEVNIGFGYDNLVFVVEEENVMILFDYDTKEVVYYLRGNLI